ncbi:uncharacterized protein KPYH43_c1915 [Klebsiella pneumoniae]|nr:uncharacterized protein KPYH43_c1915 [Klebsiella pneumoniae]
MKVTSKNYTLKSINYKFSDFVKIIKKYRKTLNSVMRITLKRSLSIDSDKFDECHTKNNFVFYTARHCIFKYIVFN